MPKPNMGTSFINQANSLVRQEAVTSEIATVPNVRYGDKSDDWLDCQNKIGKKYKRLSFPYYEGS